ncbi:Neuronal-specific septin-3 [Nibea albiflora]|uniref:Neuronal-specific septin-3 n=1 Tax=Nibea albiflora TaxID=240163 RepID=A0ACB7FJZ3_NIBAL|nr:Neuronal-specific septin-3 [Nibea albiflora]
MNSRTSVFHRLVPEVSSSSRQAKERPSVCLSPPPLSLSSPVIKKKPIQIPSFDEKGLVNTDRSFLPISSKASSRPSWTKSCQHSQRNHEERASTLPRTKPKTCSSPTLSAKPSISIFPAPLPNSSPTLRPKPSDSLHLPASHLTDPSPSLHQLHPKPSVSPTLTVPTPRLSPSPTSLCLGTSLDGRGGKQPSPVAKERRARSITISNTRVEPESGQQRPSNEAKHDVLNQEALLDFTHPPLRRVCSNTSRHQTHSEAQRQAATSQSSSSVQEKPKPPPRNTDISKPNMKQQQELQPGAQTSSEFANVQRDSQSVFDGHRRRMDCSQSAAGFLSNERIYSERSATLPKTHRMSFSTEPLLNQSPSIESRRRRFGFSSDAKVDETFPSAAHLKRPQEEIYGGPPNVRSSHKYRMWSKALSQMDTKSPVSQSECVSKDYSCQRRHNDRKTEAINQYETCLSAWRAHEASKAASADTATSKSDISKHRSHHRQPPEQNKRHKEANLMNQTDIFAPSDHRTVPAELPECAAQKCGVSCPPSASRCPFNTDSFGLGSKGVFDLHRAAPAASRPPDQPKNPAGDRAFIMEEAEDPYYVTMYYPGSVYVDMSDVVPPEVKPKPAVPAKPPNVGAPSPSSPFPPQGVGIGGGGSGVSALPPSAIPVPIGSHGPVHHSVGHSVGQGVGLGVGHGVGHAAGHGGNHTAAHNGGQAHGGSHSSSGGSTLLGYIGIDTIIEQMRRKTMKTGFDFNVMVVGESPETLLRHSLPPLGFVRYIPRLPLVSGHSGLGKSTLVNTLFKSQVSRRSAGWARDEKIPKTVEIKAVSHVLEEGGVKMKLTVVDTPGFGDQINNDNCWEPICKYINEQYEKFLKEEVNITRKKRIPDTRVHCCLYFISPTGHSLRQLDIEFMKRLSHSVNIIPIVAKADTMTLEERQEFKQRVKKELEMGGIEVYPQKEFDEDMEDKSDNDKIREAMPFAVVGSDKEYQVNGKRVLGRKTPWGIVEVENPNHCEFAQLRDFLIRSHLQDLKEVTHNIHYETYRAKRLNENGGLHPISANETQESNL